jgi:hypothetical protein
VKPSPRDSVPLTPGLACRAERVKTGLHHRWRSRFVKIPGDLRFDPDPISSPTSSNSQEDDSSSCEVPANDTGNPMSRRWRVACISATLLKKGRDFQGAAECAPMIR